MPRRPSKKAPAPKTKRGKKGSARASNAKPVSEQKRKRQAPASANARKQTPQSKRKRSKRSKIPELTPAARAALDAARESKATELLQQVIAVPGVSQARVAELFQEALAADRAMRKQQRAARKAIMQEAQTMTPYQRRKARARIKGYTIEQARGHGKVRIKDLPKYGHREDHARREALRQELFLEFGSVKAMADYFELIGLTRNEAYTLWHSP